MKNKTKVVKQIHGEDNETYSQYVNYFLNNMTFNIHQFKDSKS